MLFESLDDTKQHLRRHSLIERAVLIPFELHLSQESIILSTIDRGLDMVYFV